MSELEQRAHDLFWAMMQAPYADTTIGNIVCAETTPKRLESAWIPLITAALSAQPRGVEDRIYRGPSHDPQQLETMMERTLVAEPRDACNCASGRGADHCPVHAHAAWDQPRDAEAPDDGSDPGEFGCGIQPNPKARYWQGRADFWRGQAVALGYKPSGGDEASPQSREVRGVEYDRELIAEMLDDLLRAEAAAEDRGTTEGRSYFNRNAIATQAQLLREADNREGQARTVRLGPATTPQDAAGVEAIPAAFRRLYPEGGHSGWYDAKVESDLLEALIRNRDAGTVELAYTTPPPGVDVGKLRELVQGWRDEANAGYLTGKPEIDSITEARQHVYFECADKLDATMAEPGVKK